MKAKLLRMPVQEQDVFDPTTFWSELERLRKDRPKNLKAALLLLNKRHMAIRVGSSQAICDTTTETVAALPQTEADFKKKYQTFVYTDGGRQWPLGKHWVNWPRRRAFDGTLVFRPGAPPDHFNYNTWRSFKVHPKKGDWSLFRNHLRDIVCQGHKDLFDYLIKYFAHMVQRPGELPQVAIVIRGKQGTGKTIVYKMFERLFHPFNTVLLDDTKRIAGNFNIHLAEKVLVCADEALFAREKQIIGKLKSTITAPRMLFEAKGFDAVQLDNYIRLIIISNHEHVINAARDERRYLVLEAKDTFAVIDEGPAKRAKRVEYFDAIRIQMEDQGGDAAMMYDLLHEVRLDAFDTKVIPDSPFLARQKEFSREIHERWLADRLDRGAGWFSDNLRNRPSRGTVYADYEAFAHAQHSRDPLMLSAQLGRFLADVFGPGVGQHRSRDEPGGKQQWVYLFPRHADALEAWRHYCGETTGRLRIRRRKADS